MTKSEGLKILGINMDSYKVGSIEDANRRYSEDIKRSYRNKIKENHPDVGGSHAKTLKITEAYNILKDTKLKKNYPFRQGPRVVLHFGGRKINLDDIIQYGKEFMDEYG